MSAKSKAISAANTEKEDLSADIDTLSSDRDTLDGEIKDHIKDISDAKDDMSDAAATRGKELKEYQANSADLKAALEALRGAIQMLKASKKPSLLQVQGVSQTVKTAVMLADALGLGGASTKKLASFLQDAPANEVPMQDYDFHSDGIIETLEKLLEDFTSERNTVDEEEVKSVHKHDMFMQEKTDLVRRTERMLSDTKARKASKVEDIAASNQQLTTVSATLLDDQQYLMGLSQMCSDTAKTWDQRSRVRSDEIATLTQVIDIVADSVAEKTKASTIRFAQQKVGIRRAKSIASSEDDMESLEAEAESEEALSFLQRTGSLHRFGSQQMPFESDGRSMIVDLLKTTGAKFHSTLLTALAGRIASDPFAKIKVLIQELIDKMLQEAANEATQKGWCDKAMQDADQKRDYATEEIEEVNGQMAKLESVRDKLATEIQELTDAMADLEDERTKANGLRAQEKQDNELTVSEAKAGLSALNSAIDILDKWYKTNAKEKVDMSLLAKGPEDDAPSAGFEIGEAYTGAQGEAGGILGMLDVMKSDFERTISMTEEAEAQAVKEHTTFLTETAKSLAEKGTAKTEKLTQKGDAEDKLSTAEDKLEAQTAILEGSLKELMELKPACVDTGMSYSDRVAAREEEIEALKRALCILQKSSLGQEVAEC